jgi:hypothetical protein
MWLDKHDWKDKIVVVRKRCAPAYIGKCISVWKFTKYHTKFTHNTYYVRFIANLGSYRWKPAVGKFSDPSDPYAKWEDSRFVRLACYTNCIECQYRYTCLTNKQHQPFE